MKEKKPFWKRGWVIFLFGLLGLIIFGYFTIVNFGEASPVPVYTPLAVFEPPNNNYTSPTPPQDSVSSFPDPDKYQWVLVISGLEQPVGLNASPDGTDRLFIVERKGRIMIYQDDTLLEKPFIDLTDRVGTGFQEQGLLGMAFDPNYSQNSYFYVNYTDEAGNTVLARYRVSTNPNTADPATERRFLTVKQPFANHNGGGLAFGPDGLLYAGFGDGGLAGDPVGNAQNPDEHLGKMLVFDPNDLDTVRTYASGLRNPWRFSFDRLTGDLFIGDVGQNKFEEIDFLPADTLAGANFGWDLREGFNAYEDEQPTDPDFIEPIIEYNHDFGCSVTSGFVYRGENLPGWRGIYLYGDYCTGNIWGLLRDANGEWQNQLLFTVDANIASFGEDTQGEIYLVDLQGNVYRLEGK